MEVKNFVKNTWKLLSLKIGNTSQQAVLSAEIIQVLREDHAEADKNLFK